LIIPLLVFVRAFPLTHEGAVYDGLIEFALVNPNGFELVRKQNSTADGYIALTFELPKHLFYGEWRVLARPMEANNDEFVFGAGFKVNDYALPPFKIFASIASGQLLNSTEIRDHGTGDRSETVVTFDPLIPGFEIVPMRPAFSDKTKHILFMIICNSYSMPGSGRFKEDGSITIIITRVMIGRCLLFVHSTGTRPATDMIQFIVVEQCQVSLLSTSDSIKPGASVTLTLNGQPHGIALIRAIDDRLNTFTTGEDITKGHSWDFLIFHQARFGNMQAKLINFVVFDEVKRAIVAEQNELGVRQYFHEVWLFDAVPLGLSGTVSKTVEAPDTVGRWSISSVFWAPGQRELCAARRVEIVSKKDVFMKIDLPKSVYLNETISAKVSVTALNPTREVKYAVCLSEISRKVCADLGSFGQLGKPGYSRVIVSPSQPTDTKTETSFPGKHHCSVGEIRDIVKQRIQVLKRVETEELYKMIILDTNKPLTPIVNYIVDSSVTSSDIFNVKEYRSFPAGDILVTDVHMHIPNSETVYSFTVDVSKFLSMNTMNRGDVSRSRRSADYERSFLSDVLKALSVDLYRFKRVKSKQNPDQQVVDALKNRIGASISDMLRFSDCKNESACGYAEYRSPRYPKERSIAFTALATSLLCEAAASKRIVCGGLRYLLQSIHIEWNEDDISLDEIVDLEHFMDKEWFLKAFLLQVSRDCAAYECVSGDVLVNSLGILAFVSAGAEGRNVDWDPLANWLYEQQLEDGSFENAIDTYFASRALFEYRFRKVVIDENTSKLKVTMHCPTCETPYVVNITNSATEIHIPTQVRNLTFETQGHGKVMIGIRVTAQKRQRSRRGLSQDDAYPVRITVEQQHVFRGTLRQTVCLRVLTSMVKTIEITHGLYTGYAASRNSVAILPVSSLLFELVHQ
uniref:A2M domain-containing protein n=1 Tax=Angiostrongylus cantonensis TaxID=6313 RepID=A0A158PCV0_ANGCA